MIESRSPFLDPLNYIIRFFLWTIRLIYLICIKMIWKFLSVDSKLYQIIRKIVRQRNYEKIGKVRKSITWQEKLYLFSNTPTHIELFIQSRKSRKTQSLIGLFLSIDMLNIPALEESLRSIAKQSYPTWVLFIHFSEELSSGDQILIIQTINRFLQNYQYKVITDNPFSIDVELMIYINCGDALSPNCLYLISQEDPSDFISFDVLLRDFGGTNRLFCRPPGNSPELMISNNYLSHSAIKTSTIRRMIDQNELTYDECLESDFPILYRMVQKTVFSHHHISKILLKEGMSSIADGYLSLRKKVIRKELSKYGLSDIQCITSTSGGLRVKWKTDDEKVSIIIPSKDKYELISKCIDSIQQYTSYPNYEIIIVDNQSRDAETLAFYQTISLASNIRITHFNEPFNYAKAINLGSSQAEGKYLLFLNNDIEVINENWLTELVQWAMLPDIGAVGSMLLYPNNTIQHAGVVFDSNRLISHVFCHQPQNTNVVHGSVGWYRNYVGVTGACQMIRKEVFDTVGRYDELFTLTFSDIDICLRLMKLGYRIVYNPFSIINHCESATRTNTNPNTDIKRAYRLFREILFAGDPFFSDQIVNSFSPRVRILEPDRVKIIRYRVDMRNN
jgi:GT2 family glycosyltransferase